MKKNVLKVSLIVPLVLFITSVFLPCLSIVGFSPLTIYPPLPISIQYWSYQDATQNLGRSDVRMFQNFWFGVESRFLGFWQAWLWMFVFQVLTLVFLGLCFIKEKIKGHPIPLIGAVCSSTASVTCTCYLSIKMTTGAGIELGINRASANYGSGFFMTLASVVLLSALLILNVATEALAHSS